ncbi:MAG: hypothetical protein K5871_03470 [Lachnospiraceae bacterium]|nr:hypothetical protein [Lachnospiraceae bacterium]
MEKKQKFGIMAALIYFVIFVAYNLIVFLVFKGFNNVFWISYVFMLLAYLIHIGCAFFIGKNLSVKAAFFGIPLFSFSIFFVCAEFFASFVFMIFRNQASPKIAVLIQALLLCIFIVIAIISIMTRDVVADVDKKIKDSVSSLKGLNVDVEMLAQRSTDPETTGALNRLSETIKYSDPMTHPAVAMQDQMIMQYMPELRMAFDSGDMAKVKDLCGKIELLFVERNKKLMAVK